MTIDPVSDSLHSWVRDTLPRALAYARALQRDPVLADYVVQDCYAWLIKPAHTVAPAKTTREQRRETMKVRL